jgi:hypothetical protein
VEKRESVVTEERSPPTDDTRDVRGGQTPHGIICEFHVKDLLDMKDPSSSYATRYVQTMFLVPRPLAALYFFTPS